MRTLLRVTALVGCLSAKFALLPPAGAQVVQLPAFSTTGVDTTVVVPDRGAALLSGGGRAAAGLSTFGGVPRARGWGVSRQAYSNSVSVWIHDHQAHDRAVAERAKHSQAPPALVSGAAAAVDPAAVSAAELADRRAVATAMRDKHARMLFDKSRAARQAGKTAVAEIFLRAAVREASGALGKQIEAELSATSSEASTSRAPSLENSAPRGQSPR
jgi:hypothetical protein